MRSLQVSPLVFCSLRACGPEGGGVDIFKMMQCLGVHVNFRIKPGIARASLNTTVISYS
jgi:hypothetical protein